MRPCARATRTVAAIHQEKGTREADEDCLCKRLMTTEEVGLS